MNRDERKSKFFDLQKLTKQAMESIMVEVPNTSVEQRKRIESLVGMYLQSAFESGDQFGWVYDRMGEEE